MSDSPSGIEKKKMEGPIIRRSPISGGPSDWRKGQKRGKTLQVSIEEGRGEKRLT